MYRQIIVHPDDRRFQLIIWRSNRDHNVQLYYLNTVTYGERCSPFLALRTINELVTVEGSNYPLAIEPLTFGRYADDIFMGSDSLTELSSIKIQVMELLRKGGFELKKWASTDCDLLQGLDAQGLVNPSLFSSDQDIILRALGISWTPTTDMFSYQLAQREVPGWTKRQLLAYTARIFDPLGWISPVVIALKSLFQETWSLKTSWDDPLPDNIIKEWSKIRSDFGCLENIRLVRFLGPGVTELYGFADASRVAYAAVLFSRRIGPGGSCTVRLLAAKSRLAPVKPVSIPRLELCAAQLLAKLTHTILKVIPTPVLSVSLFSDSTTVLAWLKSLPKKWTVFVANRVGNIHELCPGTPWYYIKSKDNPANVASRGCSPSNLLSNTLWWNGPDFLDDANFDIARFPNETFTTVDEQRPLNVNVVTTKSEFWISFIERFSNFNRLIRSLCYVFRFIDIFVKKSVPITTALSAEETKASLDFLIKKVQQFSYSHEISALSGNNSVSKNSSIRTLTPFIDTNGILRVGGRLTQTNDKYFNPQPILIPKAHLSLLLIRRIHYETFHGGSKLICTLLRRSFWIPNVNIVAKAFVRSCSRCNRYKASTYSPMMGQLPDFRVNERKPFSMVGLDFAGPVMLRPYNNRGKMTVKGYIALFVCTATKAVHLELIMSLSVESLILGLRRLLARRGKCDTIISDNGRNFLGCRNVLVEFAKHIEATVQSDEVKNFLSQGFINWQFIPPYSPHFGGLWESGVRIAKSHLNKMFNGTTLTIEELTTALCQIESILNSRPLIPIWFKDPYIPLTPAHLITGYPVSHFPDDLLANDAHYTVKIRHEFLSNLLQGFWKKWRSEYLNTLIRSKKWFKTTHGPKIGDIVIVKRRNDPPRSWSLETIKSLFPGSDNCIRVVEVATANGLKREAVRNLIPLNVDTSVSPGGVC